MWRTVVIVVGVAASSVMFVQASQILIDPTLGYDYLLIAIVGGIPVIVLTVITVIFLRRQYRGYFEKTEKDIEDFEDS